MIDHGPAPLRAFVLALATGMLLAPALANAAIRITAPQKGGVYAPGSSVTVSWTGGAQGKLINAHIIDLQRYATVGQGQVWNAPNIGSTAVRLPAELTCGTPYQFYVETPDKAEYDYGGDFTLQCAASAPAPRPPAPAPAPVPTPPQFPRPITPAPLPPPPQVPAQPVRMCGMSHNLTYNADIRLEMTVKPGPGFTGTVIVGNAANQTNLSTFGGGDFNGMRTGTNCQATTTGRLSFTGQCTPTSVTASYTIDGQRGTFQVSTAGCAGR